MNSAGIFSDKSVDIQSVRLEPYVLGSNSGDRVLLACEVSRQPPWCILASFDHAFVSISDHIHGVAWQIFQ